MAGIKIPSFFTGDVREAVWSRYLREPDVPIRIHCDRHIEEVWKSEAALAWRE